MNKPVVQPPMMAHHTGGRAPHNRGPLPDWDDIQDIEADFDYMNLMDSQYAQYYALSMPPYDPSLGGMDPSVANLMIQQAQQHMAAFGLRPQLPIMQQQPLIAAPPPMPMAPEAPRPDSVASSSTPAALVSPGAVPVPVVPIPTAEPINTSIPFTPVYPQHSFHPMTEGDLKDCVRKQM